MTPQRKQRLVIYESHRAPHHRLVARLAHRFNADPLFQYRLHLIATYLWLGNMLAAVLVFVFAQGFWQRFSILYVVLISLYANFATDYGAVPAAEAAIAAEALQRSQRPPRAVRSPHPPIGEYE